MKTLIPAIILCGVVVIWISMQFADSDASMLSPARGIGGHWEGTANYYCLNIYGERAVRVNASCSMDITLNGNQVTGTLNIHPISQTSIAELAVPDTDHHITINGIYEGTTLTFNVSGGFHGEEAWQFDFLTDMATGKVTNLDTYAYLGLDSDPGAFKIARA